MMLLGVPRPLGPCRPARCSLLRPRPWHAASHGRYLGLAAHRPLLSSRRARGACRALPSEEDEVEGASASAATPEALLALAPFASVSAAAEPGQKEGREGREGRKERAGQAPPEQKRERGQIQGAKRREELAADAARGGADLLKEARQVYQRLYDRVYYGDVLPPVGAYQMSYAKLLELLSERKVKRIVLLSDGRTAIVEVPVENTETNFNTMRYNRRLDFNTAYAEENPEWAMEKNRYYCELPGDVWEEGTFMALVKDSQERRVIVDGVVRVPYDSLLQLNQVRTELQVVDPSDAMVWLNNYVGQFLPIAGLLLLRTVVAGGDWLLRRLGKEKKSEQEKLAEQLGEHKAKAYNVGEGEGKKGGKRRDTGVRYADVAGIDSIKADIQEVIDILMGRGEYSEMGASPIRGVLLEGPPGTGKTLLAKAMAGEAGIPFFSANGAEFVEMFQGVAAARIRSLFKAARKNAPAIIFIDEIDAIGKARTDSAADSGTQEREQGLLQLLTEMDGFVRDDKVLVIGATNRATALDEALLRPGRFDRSIYMGRPSPANRVKVLQVHAKNKPIPHDNDDALLRTVADLTIGYSGAELANLLNEAAILAVRNEKAEIDLSILKEAMDKVRLGLPHAPLPDSPAKRRYAIIEAARAVAFALTPGLPPVEHVTIRPRGNTVARILFVPQEFRSDGGMWHRLGWSQAQSNAVHLDRPLTQFELVCELMVPLYAARACEEVLYGKEGVSLTTSKEISRAAELARWIVVDSCLHPLNRDKSVLANMVMGGYEDPTTEWGDVTYDEYILALQQAAYERALQLVEERRPVIELVGRELCDNSDETVLGSRIVELLESTPLAAPSDLAASGAAEAEEAPSATVGASSWRSGQGLAGAAAFDRRRRVSGDGASTSGYGSGRAAAEEVLGTEVLSSEELRRVAEVVMGRIEDFDLLPGSLARTKAEQVKQQLLDPATRQRLESIEQYVASDSSFPLPPPVPEDEGVALQDWMPREPDVINV